MSSIALACVIVNGETRIETSRASVALVCIIPTTLKSDSLAL